MNSSLWHCISDGKKGVSISAPRMDRMPTQP